MAFVQTGPRRSTRVATAARGHDHAATASPPSLATASTDTQHRDADWSIVFPGRVAVDSSRGHQVRLDDQASPTLARATSSATLAPLHDGTGSFGDASIHTAASSQADVFDSALFLDDDVEEAHADDHHSDFYFENDDDAESSATPPSLDTSGGGRGRSSSFSRTRNYSHSSSSAAFSSPPLLHDEFPSADSAASPQWSWQQEGTSRVLASTTPTQHSSTILERANRPVFFDSDSEGEDQQSHPAYRRQGKAPQPSSPPPSSQDDYEADLAAAPFAMSAGLRPRPRRARALQPSAATSEISGSQASAGFKRRHRRQHLLDEDAGSVRSSKSRRSESYCGSAVAATRKKAAGAAASSSRLSSSSSSSRPRNAPQAPQVAGAEAQSRSLSKRQRATRLLARLFDVDNDVLDSVLEDQGPLALSAQEKSQARDHYRPRHAGFEHEHEHHSSAPAGWRELIDGRIVEDVDGEREEAGQMNDEAARNPILELARADWSGIELPSTMLSRDDDDDVHHLSSPTLQEAIRHALSQLRGSSAAGSDGAPTTATSAILSSTVEAIQGAMPYFVPFSWRLLMRVMKEWNGGEGSEGHSWKEREGSKAADDAPQQQRRRQISAASTSLTQNEVASLEDSTSVKSSSDKVEEWREKSGESMVSSVATMTTAASGARGRGRTRERRTAIEASNGEGSTWSLATAPSAAGRA